jgi:alkanesulfonate monooxygenase
MNLYATLRSTWSKDPSNYRASVADIATWVDNSDCRGLLVFTDHTAIDPWAAAQYLIERTDKLVPLVAAQPPYAHPYAVARMVSTLGFMYGRQVDLNLVTGGNRNDLRAIGCTVDHDARYDRLMEFAQVIQALLTEEEPWSNHGHYYDINSATLRPPLPAGLTPRLFLAGSSKAAVAAARALGVVRLSYPLAIEEYAADSALLDGTGVRFGIIARETSAAAWAVAHRRYPPDRMGERLRDFTARAHPAPGAVRMLDDARRQAEADDPHPTYWLYPFRSWKEYCPYLVGSYDEVAQLLARYLDLGVQTLIMGVPVDEDDLHHAVTAVHRAEALARRGPRPSLDPALS